MSIFIELFVSKKFLARKGEKTLETQPSKTCLDAKFRYKVGGSCDECLTYKTWFSISGRPNRTEALVKEEEL
jgi:hypothetical protein